MTLLRTIVKEAGPGGMDEKEIFDRMREEGDTGWKKSRNISVKPEKKMALY